MSAAPNLEYASLLDAALKYANAGFEIFPVSPADKAPLVAHGFNDATSDPQQVKRWWTVDYPDALIACRVPKDMIVLDIDPRHGGDATWKALEDFYAPAKVAREHHSGRGDGGRHMWFKRPADKLSMKPLHQWARDNGTGHKAGNNGWASGIDLLHHTYRYTILPPSPHPETGKPYTWLSKDPPEAVPGWLVQYITPASVASAPTPPRLRIADEHSIADWFSANSSWNDILGPSGAGWVLVHGDGDSDGSKWRHPTATALSSCSITHGCLFVYTPNTDFDETTPTDPNGYTRFRAWTILEHGGDGSAAARAARELKDGPATVYPKMTPYTPYTPGDTWEDPLPLRVDSTPSEFPVDVLPEWMRARAETISDALQAPIDIACVLGLGALSVATIGRLRVHYSWENWTQPCGLYVAAVAQPSVGKSPIKSAMFKPLEDYEQERVTAALGDRRAHAELIDVQKNRVIGHKKSMASDSGSVKLQEELRDMTLTLVDMELRMPPSGRLLADDATVEALGMVVADSGGSIGVVSAEGGLFDRLAGLYNENGMNLDLYLEGWGGGRYVIDRVKRDPITVPSATLAVITTIQPHTLDAIGAKKAFAGRGLTARFLMAYPKSTVGGRHRGRRPMSNEMIERIYGDRLTALARRFADDTIVLELDDEACDMFADWDQDTEYRLAPGGDLQHAAEWVGKLRGSVIRTAALLHVAHGRAGKVDAESMADALDVGRYFIDHAQMITELWGLDEGIAQAGAVLEWIASTEHEEFSIRDLYNARRRLFPNPEATIQPLSVLVETNHIRPMFDGPVAIGRGGKPSPRFAVNPAVRTVRTVRPGGGDGAVRTESQKGRKLDQSSSLSDSHPSPDPDRTVRTVRTGLDDLDGVLPSGPPQKVADRAPGTTYVRDGVDYMINERGEEVECPF